MGYWIWSPLLPGSAASPSGSSTIPKSATDTCIVQASDAAQAPVVLQAVTDSCPVALADPSDRVHNGEEWAFLSTILFYQTDSLPVQTVDTWRTLTDNSTFTHWEVSEPLTLGATDTAWAGFDLVKLKLDDTATPLIAVTQPVTDAATLGASDATPSTTVVIATSDTCAVQASEGSASIASSVVASDSAAVQASESVAILGTVAIADSAGLGATEALTLLGTGSVSDSLAVQASDAIPAVAVTSSVADTCAVQLSEATPNVIQLSILSATETCALPASDSTPLIGQVFAVTDSGAVQASDVIVGPHAATAQDDSTAFISEAVTNSLATSASDSGSLIAQDAQPLIALTTAVSDTCAVQLSEVASQQASGASTPITASDSCALPISEEVEPFLALFTSDACALPLIEGVAELALPADQVALMLLESITSLEITQVEQIWGGGTRAEEARFLYAGSYRMGERNPDETRGTEY